MKKILYSLVAVSVLSVSANANDIAGTNKVVPSTVLVPQVSTTDIFNYLKTNLNLTSAQQPAVQSAVNETGGKFSELFKTSSPGIKKEAEKAILDEFTKKLGGTGGILTSAQSTKLTSLVPNLQTMFSQLK